MKDLETLLDEAIGGTSPHETSPSDAYRAVLWLLKGQLQLLESEVWNPLYHSKSTENSVVVARNWRMICSLWRRYMHGLKVVLLQSGDRRFEDSP